MRAVLLASLVLLGSGREAIRGILVDAAGRPVAGVEVLAVEAERPRCCGGGRVFARAPTDSEGRFTLEAPDGEVRLVARRGVDGLAVATVSSRGPHVLRFGAGAWVEGWVLDAAGRPLAGVEVRARLAWRELHGMHEEAVYAADDTGAFRVGPIAPGTVAVIEARSPGCRPARSKPIALTEGALSPVTITLEPGETLAGTVLDGEGRPLPGATVEATQGDGFVHQAATAADGGFALTGLAARPVRLTARLDGYGMTVADVSFPSPIVLALSAETSIDGRIEPVRSGLYAVAAWSNVRERAPIGPDGRFRLARVPRRPVCLTVETSDRAPLASVAIDASSIAGEIAVTLP